MALEKSGIELHAKKSASGEARDAEPLVLRVALRHGRITLLTVLAIGAIVSLVLFLHEGHELMRFDRSRKTPQQQTALLDTYNSYSGNLAALFGKPIEMFVTAAVQVIVLRFVTRPLLQPEPSWKLGAFAFVVSTGVGYMLSNGFNALNVQLRDVEVHAVILPSDLSAKSNYSGSADANKSSSVTQSFSESAPGNPLTNTVLRNLLLPCVSNTHQECSWVARQDDFNPYLPDDIVSYGFPQREWMKQVLPQALDAQKLRIVVNATDKSANKDVRGADLPMNASIAANLFLHSLFLTSQFIPWGKNRTWTNEDHETDRFSPESVSLDTKTLVPTAVLAGILPTDPTASEAAQRNWFVNKSGPFLARKFSGVANMSTTDIVMEFSHVQLSPSIEFNALTFEVDVDPELLTTSEMNGTRQLDLTRVQCMPFPGFCLVEKRDRPALMESTDLLLDAPVQINAFAICLDENDTETLQSSLSTQYTDFNVETCTKYSTTSMLLVSVGKRLVADSLADDGELPATISDWIPDSSNVTATNVRKIYTFTVARFGWKPQDLSTEFGARCKSNSTSDCHGMAFNLSRSNSASAAQQLIISSKAMPTGLLLSPAFGTIKERPLNLLRVVEPLRQSGGFFHDIVAGDILKPHNIGDLRWDEARAAGACSVINQDRIEFSLNNHLYMEDTLQSTYTAGLFFLFQDAVVRDVVVRPNGELTLAFDGNIQDVALWMSVPRENTLLTLAGCAVIVVTLFLAIVWSCIRRCMKNKDPLAYITNPHVIARAMLDESQFPSLLLHRRVRQTPDGHTQQTVATFVINSLTFQDEKDAERRVAASA